MSDQVKSELSETTAGEAVSLVDAADDDRAEREGRRRYSENPDRLTPRQRGFVREYLLDLNGTQAIIRSGYSANPMSAGALANVLLRKPQIAAAVAKAMAERTARCNLSQDAVVNEMTALATSSLDDYYVDDEGQLRLTDNAPSNAMAAVQSIKRKTRVYYDKETGAVDHKEYDVEIKLWDKPGPLKLIGRHVGVKAFNDRIEVTGEDGKPIVTRVIREVVDAKSSDSNS